MNDLDVNFLDAICITKMWNAELHVGQRTQPSTIFTTQDNDFHSPFFGCAGCIQHVGGIATGADPEQYVAFVAEAFQVTGKDVFKSEVVANTGNMTRI